MLLLAASSAFAGLVAPEGSGSPNADDIRQLYLIIFGPRRIVFFGVGGLLIYTLVRFRARKGAVAGADPRQHAAGGRLDRRRAPSLAGDHRVVTLRQARRRSTTRRIPAPTALPVTKNGAFVAAGADAAAAAERQLARRSRSTASSTSGATRTPTATSNNLNNVFAYEQMVVPTNTTVTLSIRSQDVAHSWWIPKLGGKFDAVPGYTNYTWFKATRTGMYTGQCAELCGRNHANMTARVVAVPPAAVRGLVRAPEGRDPPADKQAALARNLQQAATKRLLQRAQTAERAAAQTTP